VLKHTVLDPYIASIAWLGKAQSGYLQTSPEFAMKQLLASGSGDIFQIAHAFRDETKTPWHRSEFLMLEWYRNGFDAIRLQDEVLSLLQSVVPGEEAYISVKDKLVSYGWDQEAPDDWLPLARDLGLRSQIETSYEILDFLVQTVVYDTASHLSEWIVYHDYPREMANHAWMDETPRRFEIYYGQVEIANGCQEETREALLLERMKKMQSYNTPLGFYDEIDEGFIKDSGTLGIVSGVAVGLDRLYSLTMQSDLMVSLVHLL
jgi:lysyl-tRNA synthetase class 2